MSKTVYVLRQYGLQSGFRYFIGSWKPLECTSSGHWFITPKACGELEEAMTFDSKSRAAEWVASLNESQHPAARPWQVAKATVKSDGTAPTPSPYSGRFKPMERAFRDLCAERDG